MLGWITKYVEWYRRGSKDEREREGEICKEKERDSKAAGKDGGGNKERISLKMRRDSPSY